MAQERVRVLIVDDSLPIRELLYEYLATRGCDVVETADGQQALGLIASTPFDVVITDLRVPGSDGMEILRRARARTPPVPCLMMTGFASVDSAVASFKAGAMDFIEKPFRLKRVWEAIDTTIDRTKQGVALESARSELELYRDCEAALTEADFRAILPRIARRVAELSLADEVLILLADPAADAGTWHVACSLWDDDEGPKGVFDPDEAAFLLRRGRPATLNAPSADAPEDTRGGRAFHLLVLPLKAVAPGGEPGRKPTCPGGIFVFRTAEKAGFSNDELVSLRPFGLLLSNTIVHTSRRVEPDI
jgi:DNA-binding response OmpR family regulator